MGSLKGFEGSHLWTLHEDWDIEGDVATELALEQASLYPDDAKLGGVSLPEEDRGTVPPTLPAAAGDAEEWQALGDFVLGGQALSADEWEVVSAGSPTSSAGSSLAGSYCLV